MTDYDFVLFKTKLLDLLNNEKNIPASVMAVVLNDIINQLNQIIEKNVSAVLEHQQATEEKYSTEVIMEDANESTSNN